MRTPKQIIGEDRLLQLVFEGYDIVPLRLTPAIACALENCAGPEHQTAEALAQLVIDYKAIWEDVLEAARKGEQVARIGEQGRTA